MDQILLCKAHYVVCQSSKQAHCKNRNLLCGANSDTERAEHDKVGCF